MMYWVMLGIGLWHLGVALLIFFFAGANKKPTPKVYSLNKRRLLAYDWACPKTGTRCYCSPEVRSFCADRMTPEEQSAELYRRRQVSWDVHFRPHKEDDDG